MAQLVITAAATAVGSYFGMPQVGFAVGSYLGGRYAAGKRKFEGPRLGAAEIVSASFGTPIPYLFGAGRMAGQVWWASARRELSTSTREGKGGGPTTTTYSYEQDVLMGLTCNASQGVARIFLNGKLIWTRLTGADDTSLANSDGTNLWTRMTVYTGEATQLPDPTYEAAVGVGNAPAYRGFTTVFFQGLQLGNSGQMPNLTFEVYQSGELEIGTASTALIYTPPTPIVGVSYGTPASAATTFQVPVATYAASPSSVSVTVQEVDALEGTVSQVGAYTIASGAYTGAATGTSDVCCWVAGSLTTAVLMASGTAGAQVTFTLPESLGITQLRFGRSGSAIVFGSSNVGAKSLHRFSTSGGSVIVSSAPLADFVNSILVVGSTVYAASKNTQKVYVLDLATLTLQSTLTHPAPGSDIWPVLFLFDDQMAVIAGTSTSGTYRVHQYVGDSWVARGDIVGTSFHATSELRPTVSVVGGLLFGGLQNIANNNQYLVWTAPITAAPGTVTLQATVEALCARAGMPDGTYDASALASITKPVRSILLDGVEPTRGTLDQLMQAYFFCSVVSDKLYFKPRPTSAAATIPLDDMAAAADQAADQPLPLTEGADLESMPQKVVRYRNVDDDYQDGSESADRLVSASVSQEVVEFGMGMTASEAKALADAMAIDAVCQLTTGSLALPLQYAYLEPGDVVDADGLRVRLGRKQDAAGVLTFEAVRHDSNAIVSAGTTDTNYTPTNTVSRPGDTVYLALDMALARDADDGPGFYVVAKGATVTWPGGQIHSSADNVTFTQVAEVLERGVFGTCTTTLGNFTGIGVDEVNALTVDVGDGTLASSTRDAMFGDEAINAALVGDEVVRFIRATLVSAGVYTLSGLIRGHRGTEWAMAAHGAAERFVLLTAAGMRRVTTTAASDGQLRYLKSITRSANSFKNPVTFTNTGRGQKCLAPVYLRTTSAAGGPVISWTRRTRYSTKFVTTGASYPLGEAAESYVVRVYADSGYTVLVRTFTAGTASVQYPAEQLLADLPAYSGGTLYVDVRQINGQGAEGYAGRSVLYVSEGDTAAGPVAGFVSTGGARVVGAFGGALVALDSGSTPLGFFERILTSSDDGASFTVALETAQQVGRAFGYSSLDVVGTKRLNVAWNYAANQKQSLAATDNTSVPTLTTPAPVVGGQYIYPAGLAIDGTDYIMAGTPQDAVTGNPVDVSQLKLYRSTDGTTWTLDGTMAADGADPNALPAGDPGSFSAQGFVGYSPTYSQGQLQKFGTRWFYLCRFALYYTDDAALLTGWKRCPTGLGEGAAWPYIVLNNLVQLGAVLVISKRGILGNSLAYSADNGATWTATRPTAQGTAEFTGLYVQGSSLVGLVARPDGIYALKATSAGGTWTSTKTSGLGTPGDLRVAVSGGNAIVPSTIGTTSALRYSADSVTWSTSTVS